MRRRLSRVSPVPRRRIPRVESLEDRRLLAILTVNSTADASPPPNVLTLREAIEIIDGTISLASLDPQQLSQVSGSLSDPNTIAFDIPGPGVQTITPASVLPAITAPVTVNGYTQPGASPNTLAIGDNAVLEIELDGLNTGSRFSNNAGLFLAGGNSTIEGLVMNRFNGEAIQVSDNGGDMIRGDFIGSDATGESKLGNLNGGIDILSGSNDLIGGVAAADRNLISGNGVQIYVTQAYGPLSGIAIQGNYIGTDATGTRSLVTSSTQGGAGIYLEDAFQVTIGGTAQGAGNLISGCNADGIDIGYNMQPSPDGILIQGNLIGTDATGEKALLNNTGTGVSLSNSSGVTIGGTSLAARNVISGFIWGIFSYEGGDHLIEGNTIGADLHGASPLGDLVGIELQDHGDTIGGTTSNAGNLITDSFHEGIKLDKNSGNTLILSNTISGNGGGIGDDFAIEGRSPTLRDAGLGPTSTLVIGTLNNAPNTPFTIQFFANTSLDAAGQAEGQQYLGSTQVTTDANGLATIRAVLPVVLAAGEWVTATASAPGRGTTPFSVGVQAQAPLPTETMLADQPVAAPSGRVYAFSLRAMAASAQSSAVGPTGSITFRDGSTVLAVVPLSPSGIASFTTPMLPPGVHHFTADYSGDGFFEPSASNVVSSVFQDIPPTLLHAQRGSHQGRPELVLTFSEAMSPAGVENPHNYRVVRLHESKQGVVIPFGRVRILSASIGSFGTVVTLTLSRRLLRGAAYRLEIVGAPPTGVAGANGTLLDGDGSGAAGTDAVVVLPSERKVDSHKRNGHR